MMKKGMCLLLCLTFVFSSFGTCFATENQSLVGKYIEFGKYNDKPVLYRIIGEEDVNKDGKAELMLCSEYVLSYKAYDSAGEKGVFVKWWDDAAFNNMKNKGSARWDRSAIRSWLNSSDKTVNYDPNSESPSATFVVKNPYDTEKGFMADGNMTESERSLIVPSTHKSLVTDIDFPRDEATAEEKALYGGTKGASAVLDDGVKWNEYITIDQALRGYDDVYYEYTTDKVFLLSLKEFKNGNFTDGDGVSHKTGLPTADAALQEKEDNTFWVRDVFGATENRHIKGEDQVGWYGNANGGTKGVRPAMYIDSSAKIVGSGTKDSPFLLECEPVLNSVNFTQNNATVNTVVLGDINAEFTMSQSNVNKEVTAFVGLYKKDAVGESLLKIAKETMIVTPQNNVINVKISVDNVDNTYIKGFVWDNLVSKKIMGNSYILGTNPTLTVPEKEDFLEVNSRNISSLTTTTAGEGKPVAILVVKDGVDMANLVPSDILYITQIETNNLGKYYTNFNLDSLSEGWFNLKAAINFYSEIPDKKFGVAGNSTIKNMVNIINAKNPQELLKMLNGENGYSLERNILQNGGYFMSEYETLGANKLSVAQMLSSSNTVITEANMQNYVNKAIMSTVYNTADMEGKNALIKNAKFSSIFNVTHFFDKEYFVTFYNSDKENKLLKATGNMALDTDYGNIFRLNAIGIIIKNAQNSADIKTLIEGEGSFIGIVFDEYYNNMKNSDKLKIYQEFLATEVVTKQDIINKFDYGYKKVKDDIEKNNNKPSGGGGSGGGGSSGGSSGGGIPPNIIMEKDYVDEIREQGKPTVDSDIYENIFTDIDDYSWAKESIIELYKANIICGKSDGIFAPSENITREEFVKIVVLATGLQEKSQVNKFRDVSDEWYSDYVSIATQAGIISGISQDEFGVGLAISREDVAVILDRVATLFKVKIPATADSITFADSEEISDYAKTAVDNLVKLKVINGMENKVFAPKIPITRAEIAKMIYSFKMECLGGKI